MIRLPAPQLFRPDVEGDAEEHEHRTHPGQAQIDQLLAAGHVDEGNRREHEHEQRGPP
jgi:hypothetical protein